MRVVDPPADSLDAVFARFDCRFEHCRVVGLAADMPAIVVRVGSRVFVMPTWIFI